MPMNTEQDYCWTLSRVSQAARFYLSRFYLSGSVLLACSCFLIRSRRRAVRVTLGIIFGRTDVDAITAAGTFFGRTRIIGRIIRARRSLALRRTRILGRVLPGPSQRDNAEYKDAAKAKHAPHILQPRRPCRLSS